jgi:hypothetical protein
LQTSFITALGPNVNLANIPFEDVIGLETLRLGIRSDTFNLYDPIQIKKISPPADEMPYFPIPRRIGEDTGKYSAFL